MNSLSTQLQEALNHTTLSEVETRECIRRAQGGDKDAVAALIAHNERLVYQICARYYFSGATGDATLDDLMQEGRMGLMHAISKFDLARTHEGRLIVFSTYATWWIRQRVCRFGVRDGMPIKMTYSSVEKRGRAIRARAALSQELERAPTPAEIQARAGVSAHIAGSLDMSFTNIEDVHLVDTETSPEGAAEQNQMTEHLVRSISNLPPAQREVVYRFYVLGESIEQISTVLGHTTIRVSNLKKKAIKQIRLTLSGLIS